MRHLSASLEGLELLTERNNKVNLFIFIMADVAVRKGYQWLNKILDFFLPTHPGNKQSWLKDTQSGVCCQAYAV